MKKIKLFIKTTYGQIFLSSILVMTIAFLCIGSYLFENMSAYITKQSSRYIQTTVKQAQERFNTSLSQVDSNILRFCNDSSVQTILLNYNQNTDFTAENFSVLRQKAMSALNYADNLESVELYSKEEQIYPYTKDPVDSAIPDDLIAIANEYNGKTLWILSEADGIHHIIAIKRILLADYYFDHGGYLVAHIKPELIDSIVNDLSSLGSCTLELTDSVGKQIYYGSEMQKNYQLASSTSPDSGWKFSIYIPNEMTRNDISWLSGIVIYGFLIGSVVFLFCSLLISRMISKPLSDMKNAMSITNGKLQANNTEYSNIDINQLNLQYNALVEKNNILIEQVFEKELLRTKAEITALQAQVNPHFIINALESLYWSLVQNEDMENAKILMAMAKLFQYILKGNDMITIEQELTFVEQYLQVEKSRFGSRLSWDYQIDEEAKNKVIPKLLIHPLVENSVKYAVEVSSSPIHIAIKVQSGSQGCIISVTDNGPGIPTQTMERILESFQNSNPVGTVSQSYGLANLYKRIKLYFDKSSDLTITSNLAKHETVVTIWIYPRGSTLS